MKYAIDRFVNNKSGKEIEISASDIYEMYSGRIIPHKSERFFCPECQEQVFWRCRGGNQPDKFCHKKKTDFTPECDKRVDGNSELYTYERTGLPIYLTHENGDIYNLNIAFPGLGHQTIQEAYKNNASVTINNKSTINITPTNFYADSMTLIPIDFTPHSETNYIISISGDRTEAIQKKWSNYADGFSSEGAIFAIHNSFGKKIRRGDSIAIGKEYYLVSKNIYSLPPEFSLKKIGKITLNNCNYNIYTFIINVSVDSNRFSIINNYMYSHFKIWLIEEAATIMPIWPPVSDQGELIAFPNNNNNKIYCDVKSGNEIPKVFTYKGKNAIQVIVDIDSNDNKTVSLDLYNTVSTIASVDRKYTGREISIRKAVISDEKESCTISLLSQNGKILDISGTINENDIKDGINIVTSTRFILVFETSTHIFKTISVDDKTLFVKPFQNVKRLIFINSDSPTEFKIFKTVNIQPPQTVCDINESEWIYNIKRRSQGMTVPVPLWINEILHYCDINQMSLLKENIKSAIRGGTISISLIQYLNRLRRLLKNE